MGPLVRAALDDPRTIEVMANADGRLWVERAGAGREAVGIIAPTQVESLIRLVADHAGERAGPRHPLVSGTLPADGSGGGNERFQGQLPPVTTAPTFVIRKRPNVIYTLDDYVRDGTMTAGQAADLRTAIERRDNILIVGGTGSGKTTLANAILAEPVFMRDRIVVIEDTRELQCSAPDRIELLTKNARPRVTLDDLVKAALRLRPDRIVVGEVRGGEALALLKAWNTGHPGGLATIHANGTMEALHRVEDLAGERSRRVSSRTIARAVNIVVFICRTQAGRRVDGLARVVGEERGDYRLETVS